MGAIPENESFRGIESKLREAEEEPGSLTPAKALHLRNTKLVPEEGEDLFLSIEGSNGSDVAHSLPCNHAGFCMGLCCVSSKSFE